MLHLIENPIIAVARKDEDFEKTLKSPSSIIFLLSANLVTVKERVERAHEVGKKLFVHMDMVLGIGKDRYGLEFLKNVGTDGIISTKNNIIACAKELGLITVQRFFMLDSQSVTSALDNVKSSTPDMVELLPGVLPQIIKQFSTEIKQPVIAGGLIRSKEEIISALSHGATAVSTATEKLWYE